MDDFGVFYGVFLGVPDMMEHTKCVFDIPSLCKSKMAATNL